jgi:hypothetical protein
VRLVADEAVEARLGSDLEVGQRLRCDVDHVARALGEAAQLAGALGDRPPDLPGDFARTRLRVGDDRIHQLGAKARAIGQRSVTPGALRMACRHQQRFDLCAMGQLALDVDAAVDGRDRGLQRHCARIAHPAACAPGELP